CSVGICERRGGGFLKRGIAFGFVSIRIVAGPKLFGRRRRKGEKQNPRAGKRGEHCMLARHAVNPSNSWPEESHMFSGGRLRRNRYSRLRNLRRQSRYS